MLKNITVYFFFLTKRKNQTHQKSDPNTHHIHISYQFLFTYSILFFFLEAGEGDKILTSEISFWVYL